MPATMARGAVERDATRWNEACDYAINPDLVAEASSFPRVSCSMRGSPACPLRTSTGPASLTSRTSSRSRSPRPRRTRTSRASMDAETNPGQSPDGEEGEARHGDDGQDETSRRYPATRATTATTKVAGQEGSQSPHDGPGEPAEGEGEDGGQDGHDASEDALCGLRRGRRPRTRAMARATQPRLAAAILAGAARCSTRPWMRATSPSRTRNGNVSCAKR